MFSRVDTLDYTIVKFVKIEYFFVINKNFSHILVNERCVFQIHLTNRIFLWFNSVFVVCH